MKNILSDISIRQAVFPCFVIWSSSKPALRDRAGSKYIILSGRSLYRCKILLQQTPLCVHVSVFLGNYFITVKNLHAESQIFWTLALLKI